jgi:C4-dicarboxylate-specific signal transduction histidine kinase
MIESVQLIVESALKSHSIQLNIILHHIVELHTYENEVKQVLLNLIKNAEDALIENKIQDPQINIIVDNHTLVISDNAGGVPEDIIDKIFDPYFSTKTKKDGTGIGLYMSKMIIEDHCGGILSVRNGKEGAEFTIYLGEKDA